MTSILYKTEIGLLKVIPMLIAGIYLLNTILSYFYVDLPILSWIGGFSLLSWVFLYVSSWAFHFCLYHRMFLYYIATCNVISWLDYSMGLLITDREWLLLNIILAGIFLFIILYLKFKVCKH